MTSMSLYFTSKRSAGQLKPCAIKKFDVWLLNPQELPSRATLKGWISDWDDQFLFHCFWAHKLTLSNTFPIRVSPVMLPYTKECFGQSALKTLWNNQ